MKLHFLRHATLKLHIDEHVFLVDPMLSDAAAMDPIQNSGDTRRNPLVPMPISNAEILDGVSTVLVTHTHRDHWDDAASAIVPRHTRILCQPEDAERFYALGYDDVRPVHSAAVLAHVGLYRTGGRHGSGDLAKAMGPVSGFMMKTRAGETIYIAGDTIWCNPVRDALMRYRPAYTVVNCGGARFVEGGPITMTAADVAKVAIEAPFTKVIAVHMEAINHCHVLRADLDEHLRSAGLRDRVLIPNDGELLEL